MARPKAVASPSKLAGTPGLVSVYTLGRFEVAIDGHPLRFKSKSRRKPLELLKVLVSLGGEGTSVVQLTESLWPDSEGDHAYGAFTVNLNRLRRLIGHDSLRLQDGRLHLNAERCWVDAQAFTQLLASASRAIEETRGDEAWRHLEEALRLYRGPFLEGEFDPPEILSARERLHGLFLRHIEQLGDFYQQSGQQAKAIVLYQKGLEIDDLGEELYQNLMRCYLQLDRLVEGVAVYERCRKIFRASVSIDPSPDTEAIYQQLVNAQHRPRPVAPSPEPAPAPEGPAVEPAEQAAEQVAERLEETSTPHPEGERRTATIACYGISGYASMNELLDPEEVEGIMGRIREAALRIVEHEEGIVNQFAGNEVLALFGFPRAHEDDPERAVRCAIKLHEFVRGMSTEVEKTIAGPLRMHSGINTGLIVIHPGDSRDGRYGITGDAVNTAERLLAEATADEILVSPETHRLIEPFFHTVSLDPSSAQGNLRPLTAHRVVRESRMRSRFEAAQQRGFTPFTGREQELAILRECVDKACAGEGQLVTVVGEAGLGKSRLIYELRHGMERGRMAELQGHCLPNGINTPYLPFLDGLRRGLRLRGEDTPARQVEKMVVRNVRQVDPQLERYIPLYLHLLSLDSEEFPLPPHLQGEDLRTAIEEALAAIIIMNLRHKPMLLVLESWHWADEASVTTVHKLMGVIAHNPMLLVINYRPEYPARWGNMSHHTHISLKPLDSAQTGHIARSAFRCETLPDGLPEMIHKRTEGNPFFIEELCGALVEEQLVEVKGGQSVLARPLEKITFPDTVQAVLRARLDRLSSTALDALRMAAVIGLQFGQEVLQRLSKTPQQLPACLETLKSLDLIFQVQVFPEVVYRFRHAITQMVAYESLLMQRRKDLHERVGQALEEDYADRLEEHYEALAHHYRNTSNTEKALHYLECAGHKAHQYFSLVEAREHYRAAIDLIQTQEPTVERKRRQVDLAVKLGTVSFYSPSQDLLTVLETSLEYARELKDDGRIARATTWIGMIHYAMGNHAHALTGYQECLKMDEVVRDEQQHALIINYMGRNYFYLAEFPKAVEQLQRGIPMLQRLDRMAEALNSTGILMMTFGFTGEFAKGEALGAKVLKVAADLKNPTIESMGLVCTGLPSLMRGDWMKSRQALEKAREISRHIGNPLMEGLATWGIGYAQVMTDERDEGFALMHEGIEIIQSTESELGLSAYSALLAQHYAREGNMKEATTLANWSLKLSETHGARLGEHIAHSALAIVAAGKNWKKAQASMKRCIQLARQRGACVDLAQSSLYFAELCRDRGDIPQARSHLKEASKLFREREMDWWLKEADKVKKSLPAR